MVRHIDIRQYQFIGALKTPAELFREILGPCIAVRLEDHYHPFILPVSAGIQHSAYLGRVMGIIVYQHNTVNIRPEMESSLGPGEVLHRTAYIFE